MHLIWRLMFRIWIAIFVCAARSSFLGLIAECSLENPISWGLLGIFSTTRGVWSLWIQNYADFLARECKSFRFNFLLPKLFNFLVNLTYSILRNKHRATLINFWKNLKKKNQQWLQCLDWCKKVLKSWCEELFQGLRVFQKFITFFSKFS